MITTPEVLLELAPNISRHPPTPVSGFSFY
jgi:hypothetical protein